MIHPLVLNSSPESMSSSSQESGMEERTWVYPLSDDTLVRVFTSLPELQTTLGELGDGRERETPPSGGCQYNPEVQSFVPCSKLGS